MIDLHEKITRESLLEYNSEAAYISRYTGLQVRRGKFKSPFRKDDNPSCSFYKTSDGVIILKDFAHPEYDCDFVKAAMLRYNCKYGEALRLIAEDFCIIKKRNNSRYVIEESRYTEESLLKGKHTFIRIEKMKFNDGQLEYWKKYGITKEILRMYRIMPCLKVFVNDKIVIDNLDGGNVFGYFYKNDETEDGEYIEYWRIYRPATKNKKKWFISNWKKEWLQGYVQLPEKGKLLVVTKSMKDVMCMKVFGISAIAPCSENLFVDDIVMEELKERFKNIIVMYDNDKAGLMNMISIRKKYPEFLYMWIPHEYGCKDFSDLIEKYGVEKVSDMISKVKKFVSDKLYRAYCKRNEKRFFSYAMGIGGYGKIGNSLRDSEEYGED